jgi:hypothetical protein
MFTANQSEGCAVAMAQSTPAVGFEPLLLGFEPLLRS